jgi:hypothetical protein
MSLKAFHIVFIVAAMALTFGCAVWGLKEYWSADGEKSDLLFALGSLVVGVGLIFYERYFLKKFKNVPHYEPFVIQAFGSNFVFHVLIRPSQPPRCQPGRGAWFGVCVRHLLRPIGLPHGGGNELGHFQSAGDDHPRARRCGSFFHFPGKAVRIVGDAGISSLFQAGGQGLER